MINGKMKRSASGVTDSKFASMGKGYYFLMGSIDEPTRQARAGSGYPHDFLPGEDGMRPMITVRRIIWRYACTKTYGKVTRTSWG